MKQAVIHTDYIFELLRDTSSSANTSAICRAVYIRRYQSAAPIPTNQVSQTAVHHRYTAPHRPTSHNENFTKQPMQEAYSVFGQFSPAHSVAESE